MLTEEVRADLIDACGSIKETIALVADRLKNGADVGWSGVCGIVSTRMFVDCLNSFLVADPTENEV